MVLMFRFTPLKNAWFVVFLVVEEHHIFLSKGSIRRFPFPLPFTGIKMTAQKFDSDIIAKHMAGCHEEWSEKLNMDFPLIGVRNAVGAVFASTHRVVVFDLLTRICSDPALRVKQYNVTERNDYEGNEFYLCNDFPHGGCCTTQYAMGVITLSRVNHRW